MNPNNLYSLAAEYERSLTIRNLAESTIKEAHRRLEKFFEYLSTSSITHIEEITKDTIKDYQIELYNRLNRSGRPNVLTQEQKDQFFDLFKSMTIGDAAEMKKRIEDELGIEASAAVAAMPMQGGPAAEAAVEEPTEFNVTLTEIGDKKIQVIKAVREITGAGLKDAKAMVDGCPTAIKEAVGKEEAEETKEKLEAAGAKAEMKPA